MKVVRLDEIQVGERGRSDLGDVKGLSESIDAIGLLHPVVVNEGMELVAGERRMAAVRLLGWTEVPVTMVNLDNAADVLRGELEENTCRKSLSAYEADVIRQKREKALAPKAKEQQGKRSDLKPSAKLAEGPVAARETRKAAAVGTGYSGSTLDKVRTMRDAAERGVVRQGKAEVPAPEPVREVAKQAVEKVKETGAAIDSEFKRVTHAIDQFVEADVDVKRAKRVKEFATAVGATEKFRAFDFASLPVLLSAEDWESFGYLVDSIERAVVQFKEARPRTLRAVEGGRS